jgi:hypothetical protein
MKSQWALTIALLLFHLILKCSCRSASIYQKEALHKLRGRPAFVKDESIVLQRLDISSFRTFNDNSYQRQQHQFIVRVQTKGRAEVLALLQRSSQYVRYLPHDTILVALTYQEISNISALKNVADVFELPSSMKMRPDLNKGILDTTRSSDSFLQQLIRRREASGNCEQVQLTLDLISTVDDVPSLVPDIVALCSEKASVNRSLCELILGASTRNKLVVNTDECLRNLAAQQLAEHPAVSWVEVRAKMRLRNKYATRIIQSDTGSSWALWDKGLKGNGEVRMLTFLFHASV